MAINILKKEVSPLMKTIVSGGFAVQIRVCSFLPPSAPAPPEIVTAQAGMASESDERSLRSQG